MSIDQQPIKTLAVLLAELAHDFTVIAATGAPRILSIDEQQALAETLRDCAAQALAQAGTFARIVDERNQLLAAARESDLIAFARAGAPHSINPEPMLRLAVSNPAPKVVDLTRFARAKRDQSALDPAVLP